MLGPLDVIDERGDPLSIAGSKERTILAHLIARSGRVVPADELIDDLWGDHPPRTAERTLVSYVSRLRRMLGPGQPSDPDTELISSRAGGYSLDTGRHEIDAEAFQRLSADARRLLDEGKVEDAIERFEAALGLWRGAAYQEFRSTTFGDMEGERLAELRRTTDEDLVYAKLGVRTDARLVADLEAMVADEPLRERRWGQLMLALYRSGRQAEALHAFTRARSVLVEELGLSLIHI